MNIALEVSQMYSEAKLFHLPIDLLVKESAPILFEMIEVANSVIGKVETIALNRLAVQAHV
jgi:hypothetical protein